MFYQSLLFASVLLGQTFAYIIIPLNKNVPRDYKNAHNLAQRNNSTTLASAVSDEINVAIGSYQYYTEILVGSKKQNFSVLIETTVDETAILSANSSAACRKDHSTFNSSESTTYKNTTVMPPYVNYDILEFGNDTVQLGNLTVTDQPIQLFTKDDCSAMATDGTLGLGLSVEDQLPSLIDNLYLQGKVEKPIVGLQLNRNWNSTKGGEMSIGGLNEKLYSSIRYIKATPNVPYWSMTLDSIQFGDTKLDSNKLGLIHSSTPFISVPAKAFGSIRHIVKGIVIKDNFILIDKALSKDFPSLVFTIGNNNFTLLPSDYVNMEVDINGLNPLMLTLSPEDKWYLGSAFLGKYYTVLHYENREIGFADYKGGVSRCHLFMPLLLIMFLVNMLK